MLGPDRSGSLSSESSSPSLFFDPFALALLELEAVFGDDEAAFRFVGVLVGVGGRESLPPVSTIFLSF